MILPFFMQTVRDLFTKDISISTHSNGTDCHTLEVSRAGGFFTPMDIAPGEDTIVHTYEPTINPLRNKPTSSFEVLSDRSLEMLGWQSRLDHDGYTCTPMFLYYDINNCGNEVCRHGVILRRATDAYGTVLYR